MCLIEDLANNVLSDSAIGGLVVVLGWIILGTFALIMLLKAKKNIDVGLYFETN